MFVSVHRPKYIGYEWIEVMHIMINHIDLEYNAIYIDQFLKEIHHTVTYQV